MLGMIVYWVQEQSSSYLPCFKHLTPVICIYIFSWSTNQSMNVFWNAVYNLQKHQYVTNLKHPFFSDVISVNYLRENIFFISNLNIYSLGHHFYLLQKDLQDCPELCKSRLCLCLTDKELKRPSEL